jgi:hypothetical protein
LRFSSSAFFSLTRATRAGDWPPALAESDGCRTWDASGLDGNPDMFAGDNVKKGNE